MRGSSYLQCNCASLTATGKKERRVGRARAGLDRPAFPSPLALPSPLCLPVSFIERPLPRPVADMYCVWLNVGVVTALHVYMMLRIVLIILR